MSRSASVSLGWAAVKASTTVRGHPDVPVLDPMPVTVRVGEALAHLGLSQRGHTYPPPDAKPIVGYDDPGLVAAHPRPGR